MLLHQAEVNQICNTIVSEAEVKPELQSNKLAAQNELGGDGPDPTRYGNWERNGHCIDF
ncbi:MAG: DUF1674 domain-containing protein [Methylococcaceae bacterium]|nr:DUF1674 domain-containing protein [Methylococcaceae bacterium]